MDLFGLISSKFSPEQKKMKENFDSAKSAAEMIDALKDLERCFPENDLGFSCLTVAIKLYEEDEVDSEKVLFFAKRALTAMLRFDANNNVGRAIVYVHIDANLEFLGSTCSKLNRFDESSKILSWAVRIVEKLERNTPSLNKNGTLWWLGNLRRLHCQLYDVKREMGKDCHECMSHLLKNLEITEKISGKYSKELAEAYVEVASVYCMEAKSREGLPFCMKAFEIYTACAGDNSVGIGRCSQLLGIIFSAEGDHEKALEHNLFSLRQLMKSGIFSTSLLLFPEIEAASNLSRLGRHEEAVQALKNIIPRTGKHGVNRIFALTHMADAFMEQEKLENAKKCSEIICRILEKREKKTIDGVFGYMCSAMVYEKRNDFETAISLLQKAISIIEEQDKLHASILKVMLTQVSRYLVTLLQSAGKVEDAIPYLEVDVQSKGKEFGSKSVEVAVAYSDLGTAYFATNKLQMAAQAYGSARDILEERLGSHHMDSVKICKSLCWTYEAMGSYFLAIPILEEIIRRLEVLGPSVQDDLDEALRIMAEFVEKASVPVTNNSPQVTKSEDDKIASSDVLESLNGLKISDSSESTQRCVGISWTLPIESHYKNSIN